MANQFIARKGLIALADSQITGSLNISQNIVAGGTIQVSFAAGTSTAISGAFDSVSSSLAQRVTPLETSVSSLNSASSSYLLNTSDTLVGDLTVTGKITAQEFHTEFVSASILYDSGSTKFGNSSDDTHTFTGSLKSTGTGEFGGDVLLSTSGTSIKNILQFTNSDVLGEKRGQFVLQNPNEYYVNSGDTYIWRIASVGGAGNSGNYNNNLSFLRTTRLGVTDESVFTLNGYTGAATFSSSVTAVGSMSILGSAGSGKKLYLEGSATKYNFMIAAQQNVDNALEITPSSTAGGSTFSNPAVIINSAGNVGLGTTSPTQKLEVKGNIRLDSRSKSSSGEIDSISFTKDRADAGTGTYSMAEIRSFTTNGYSGGLTFYSGRHTGGGNYDLISIMTIGSTSDIGAANVGIGTSSPAAPLDIVSNSNASAIRIRGRAADDIAEVDFYNYANSSLMARLQVDSGYLAFVLGSERMRITSGGDVLIGQTTNAYSHKLAINGESSQAIIASTNIVGNDCVSMWNKATSGDNVFAGFYVNSSIIQVGTIKYNRSGGLTQYNTTSDYRLKSEINDFNGLNIVLNLKPKEFRIRDSKDKVIGFIAHELKEYFPQAVTGEKDEVKEDGTPIYQSVDYSQLTGLLAKAIQEQQEIINDLKAEIETLKAQINA